MALGGGALATDYVVTLRGEAKQESNYVEGVPFFVPHLSNVKTAATCSPGKSELMFVFENDRQFCDLPYRKQGDVDMYTDINMNKRTALKENKQIHEAISLFWETFDSVRRGKKVIEKNEFIDVFLKMFKALVEPSEFSLNEARRIVEKDWYKDVGSVNSMTWQTFQNSLFEVADIWTPTTSNADYCLFLEKLFHRITMVVYDKKKSIWLRNFKELDIITSFHADEHTDKSAPEHLFPNQLFVDGSAEPATDAMKRPSQSHLPPVSLHRRPSSTSEESKRESTPGVKEPRKNEIARKSRGIVQRKRSMEIPMSRSVSQPELSNQNPLGIPPASPELSELQTFRVNSIKRGSKLLIESKSREKLQRNTTPSTLQAAPMIKDTGSKHIQIPTVYLTPQLQENSQKLVQRKLDNSSKLSLRLRRYGNRLLPGRARLG